MSLKVIGTGLGRTGTHSLKLALEHLGFGKCYHMFELFRNPHELHYFEEAEKGLPVNWDELFRGYASAVDYPVARYYRQLIAKYPDAKVIHTIRDPESWYQSCVETIFWASKPSLIRILKMMIRMPFSATVRSRMPVLKFDGKLLDWEFGDNLKDKQKVIHRYNERNKEVLNTVPRERLLVYNVKDGWEPLCKFLQLPVPSAPFPKSNTRTVFKENVKILSSGKPMVAEKI